MKKEDDPEDVNFFCCTKFTKFINSEVIVKHPNFIIENDNLSIFLTFESA